jgi:C7-cyclitol 7-kinase
MLAFRSSNAKESLPVDRSADFPRTPAGEFWLCVDIGYTFTRFAVIGSSGIVELSKTRTPTTWHVGSDNGNQRREVWLQSLSEQVADLRQKWPGLSRGALCFPGVVSNSGSIWQTNTIWGTSTDDYPQEALSARLGLPIQVLNDLSAATVRYGESIGSSKDGYLMVVTVSSGIGAKMYDCASRKLVLEPRGRNGEIGLATVDYSPEALGNESGKFVGTLGNYSSGYSFPRLVRMAATGGPTDVLFRRSVLVEKLSAVGSDVVSADRLTLNRCCFEALAGGDEFCLHVLSESTMYLARALHTVILFNAPEKVVVIGGFAGSVGEIYLDMLREKLASFLHPLYAEAEVRSMIEAGDTGDMDNLLGLALWIARSCDNGATVEKSMTAGKRQNLNYGDGDGQATQ